MIKNILTDISIVCILLAFACCLWFYQTTTARIMVPALGGIGLMCNMIVWYIEEILEKRK